MFVPCRPNCANRYTLVLSSPNFVHLIVRGHELYWIWISRSKVKRSICQFLCQVRNMSILRGVVLVCGSLCLLYKIATWTYFKLDKSPQMTFTFDLEIISCRTDDITENKGHWPMTLTHDLGIHAGLMTSPNTMTFDDWMNTMSRIQQAWWHHRDQWLYKFTYHPNYKVQTEAGHHTHMDHRVTISLCYVKAVSKWIWSWAV